MPSSNRFHNVPDGFCGEAFSFIFRHTDAFFYMPLHGVSGIHLHVDLASEAWESWQTFDSLHL